LEEVDGMKDGLRPLVNAGITYGEFQVQEKSDLGNENWARFVKKIKAWKRVKPPK
jgi:hypothetical protein